MQKHTYTHELAPTNTGSLERPARINLRETVEVHARTLKAFSAIRELTGMPKDASLADIWEFKILPAIEHINWHARESPSAVRDFVTSLFRPLPKEDYVRARYEQLKMRFEK